MFFLIKYTLQYYHAAGDEHLQTTYIKWRTWVSARLAFVLNCLRVTFIIYINTIYFT